MKTAQLSPLGNDCPWYIFKCRLLSATHTYTHIHGAAWPHTMCTSQIWLRPHVCHTVDSSPLCTPCRPNTQHSVCVCVCVCVCLCESRRERGRERESKRRRRKYTAKRPVEKEKIASCFRGKNTLLALRELLMLFFWSWSVIKWMCYILWVGKKVLFWYWKMFRGVKIASENKSSKTNLGWNSFF